MFARSLVLAAAFALGACGQDADIAGSADAPPQLEAPAADSEPSRSFAANNDAARTATGDLTVAMSTRLPEGADASPQDLIVLRGANGLQVEAELVEAVSPATQVDGQTLRALLAIPVEEPQTLVYRVVTETKPESGQGLCAADAPTFVVVWEPAGPGEPLLKALGVTGAAPGAQGSRACTLLEYRRS